jgi:YYY domain-containing protein
LDQPFSKWYALGYTDTSIGQGSHTPISAYLAHWGLFLFLIVSWMVWETLDWMANTPVSSLQKLKSALGVILLVIIVLSGGIVYLMVEIDAPISWLVMILAAWAAVLLLRPGMPDTKRLVLFLIGTGLVLTQTVEVIVLSGDVGRMNTVFKFYLQVWVLFGVSAAASLGWLLSEATGLLREYLERLYSPVQRVWQFVLVVLIFGAAMYPAMAGLSKIKDRMTENAPNSLNGQEYLTVARYNYNGVDMALDEDYRAIRWLEENIQGSPTIVEAQLGEYSWGSRISINTGLPAVLGWNWHQRQQRTGHDQDVWDRYYQITDFYNTPIQEIAVDFLNRYHVRYIIVGQLERAFYTPDGLAKFELWNGQFWHEVYRDGQTVIYQVGGS